MQARHEIQDGTQGRAILTDSLSTTFHETSDFNVAGVSRVATFAAHTAIIIGAILLLCCALQIQTNQPILPAWLGVRPNSALMTLLLGTSMWLVLPQARPNASAMRYRAGQVIAIVAALLALNCLRGHMPALGFETDLASVSSDGSRNFSTSFPTCLSTLALALALLLLDVRVGRIWISEVLAVFNVQIALLALVGHIFGVPELYGSVAFHAETGMRTHSAVAFLLFGAALLSARTDHGLTAVLRSQTPGGTLARRWTLIPGAVLLLMGMVYLLLYKVFGVDRAIASWALFMTSLVAMTAAVWATALVLHHAGLEHEDAQRALEKGVRERTLELKEANLALAAAKQQLARTNLDLEGTIQERTAHLGESIRSLETVCYNIAHDLRAPNRAISGFAQVLLAEHSEGLDETARVCLERIAAAAERSDALTLDLLAYGRLAHADLPCGNESLETHVQAVLEQLAPELNAAKASVEIIRPLPHLWANPIALHQVLANLIANAIKFVPEGVTPRVTIRAEDAGGRCRICIQDNGIGIPVEHQQSIFGVFQRLHSAQEYPGTGIGLAIVQKSVERMDGKVGVHSSPGNGSCFWFELKKSEVEAV